MNQLGLRAPQEFTEEVNRAKNGMDELVLIAREVETKVKYLIIRLEEWSIYYKNLLYRAVTERISISFYNEEFDKIKESAVRIEERIAAKKFHQRKYDFSSLLESITTVATTIDQALVVTGRPPVATPIVGILVNIMRLLTGNYDLGKDIKPFSAPSR